jgi:hypothetical protein
MPFEVLIKACVPALDEILRRRRYRREWSLLLTLGTIGQQYYETKLLPNEVSVVTPYAEAAARDDLSGGQIDPLVVWWSQAVGIDRAAIQTEVDRQSAREHDDDERILAEIQSEAREELERRNAAFLEDASESEAYLPYGRVPWVLAGVVRPMCEI